MKIRITMKDPDGVYNSVMYHVTHNLGMSGTMRDLEIDRIMESDKFKKVFEFEKYLTVDYDPETGYVEVVYND